MYHTKHHLHWKCQLVQPKVLGQYITWQSWEKGVRRKGEPGNKIPIKKKKPINLKTCLPGSMYSSHLRGIK